MADNTQPLLLGGFEDGIADSPHKGITLLRNVDIESFPGAARVVPKTTTNFHTSYTSTFTAVAASDICTSDSGVPNTGTAVKCTSSGTLPAGLTANTVYFINKLSDTTFELCTTIANANAGTQVDITDTGSGTHTVTTVNPGTINHIVKDGRTSDFFGQDSNGRIWYGSQTGRWLLLNNSALDNAVVGSAALANAAGNGIALWKLLESASTYYLVSFRNAVIDIADVYGTSDKETPSWTNAWQALNSGAGSGNRHQPIVGQDDIVYWVDDRYIGSLKENSGTTFAPGTSNTYTYNSQALDTPAGELLVCIEEQGANVLAGSSRTGKIYPWDRTSDSFNLPLICTESNVQRLKNIGSKVMILAGTAGNIYSTNGSTVRFEKTLPRQVINQSMTLQSNVVTWGGVSSSGQGAFLFGAGVLTTANSGVYKLYPDGRLVITNIPSSGAGNATAIYAGDDFFNIGFASGAAYVDTSLYSSFEGVIQWDFMRVATKVGKGTYSHLECVIAKPSATGNVRVSYRTDTSSSFTTLATFAADGSTTTFMSDIGLSDIENIQVQAEIDGAVELLEVRLLP